jgi:hypothetical protein
MNREYIEQHQNKKSPMRLHQAFEVIPLGAVQLSVIVTAYCKSITYRRIFTVLKINAPNSSTIKSFK